MGFYNKTLITQKGRECLKLHSSSEEEISKVSEQTLNMAEGTRWVFNPRTPSNTELEQGQNNTGHSNGGVRGAAGNDVQGCGFLKFKMTQRLPQGLLHYVIVKFGLKQSEANPQVKGFSEWLKNHFENRTECRSSHADCNIDQQTLRNTGNDWLTSGVQVRVDLEREHTFSFLGQDPGGCVVCCSVL